MLQFAMRLVRTVVPTAFLFGVAPHYYVIWLMWRAVSTIMPAHVYQVGDDFLYSLYQRLVLFFFENLAPVELVFHGDAKEVLQKKERVIYLSNHQSSMDWIIVHMLAERQGTLGHVRYVMKDSLQLIPLYGFYFYEHGCIYVKRGKFSHNKMKSMLTYLRNKLITSWLVIFPEGTRFNPKATESIEKCQSYAREQGFTPLNHLLSPRTTGLQLALEGLKGNVDAIYDTTVIYSGTKDSTSERRMAPSMFEVASGVCQQIHIHVSRIDIRLVPSDEAEIKPWLYDVYARKDRLLQSYYSSAENGMPAKPWDSGCICPVISYHMSGAFLFFLGLAVPTVVSAVGRNWYWKTWLYGSLAGYFWLGIKSVA